MFLLIVFEVELVGSLDMLADTVEAEEEFTLADLTPRNNWSVIMKSFYL
jgi:hypothetical protein